MGKAATLSSFFYVGLFKKSKISIVSTNAGCNFVKAIPLWSNYAVLP